MLAFSSDLKLKGVATNPANSQISSAFYSTKTHPPSHKDDDSDSISPSTSDMNGPLPPPPPPPQQIPHQLRVLRVDPKNFFAQIDWPALQKDFSSKENQVLRQNYRARFSEREKDLLKVQWIEKMIESQKHILFFDFLQKYFPSDSENNLPIGKRNLSKKIRLLSSLLITLLKIFSLIAMDFLLKAPISKILIIHRKKPERLLNKTILSINLFILLGNNLIVWKKSFLLLFQMTNL